MRRNGISMTTETSNICRWECNRDVRRHEIPNEKIQAGDERGDAMDEPLRWFAYMSRSEYRGHPLPRCLSG
jgi:hypothetical protein